VTLKVKIEVDGNEVFCHKDPLNTKPNPEDPACQAHYDIEEY